MMRKFPLCSLPDDHLQLQNRLSGLRHIGKAHARRSHMITAPRPGSDPEAPAFNQDSAGTYLAQNMDSIYSEANWALPNPTDYLENPNF